MRRLNKSTRTTNAQSITLKFDQLIRQENDNFDTDTLRNNNFFKFSWEKIIFY